MTPVGAEPYPRMRELLRLPPDEAAKRFEQMQEEYLRNLSNDGSDVTPISRSQPGGRLVRLAMSLEGPYQQQPMRFKTHKRKAA